VVTFREAVEDALVIGDLASRVQQHDAVDQHLGVDAEVALGPGGEELRDAVGDGADAELQRRAVLDQPLNVPRDRRVRVGDRASGRTYAERSDSITQSTSETWTR